MKLQKLTIHNIASIEDANIDFSDSPLANSDVFLITGNTGAGKSTILDAICLALYGNTPRLKNNRMEGELQDVKISAPGQLLRRNTGEGFVRLSFVGNNGVAYEATWTIARAYNKADGKLKNKEWTLKNLDANITLDIDKDIKAEIKSAIGLDFSQFCRTTLLAQGEFTKFLNSKDDEKAEILEKITGVDVYTKLGAKIYEVTNSKKKTWESLQERINDTTLLTEAQIKEKTDALSDLNGAYEKLKSEKDIIENKKGWLVKDKELEQAVLNAKIEHTKAIDDTKTDEFLAKVQLVEDWKETTDARPLLLEIEKANVTKEEQTAVLASLKTQFCGLLGGRLFEENELKEKENDYNRISEWLDKEKDKAPVYENSQTIVSLLNSIQNGNDLIAEQKTIIRNEETQLNKTLNPALKMADEACKEAKTLVSKKENEIKQKDSEVSNLHLPDLRKNRDACKELIANIAKAKECIVRLNEAIEKRNQTAANLQSRLILIQQKEKDLADLNGPIHDAELLVNDRKNALDKQNDTIQNFASTMRSKLHVGDVCPVCQQIIISELPHEDVLKQLVDNLSKDYDEASNNLKQLIAEKNKLEAEIEVESNSYLRDKNAFDEDLSVPNAESCLRMSCHVCGIESVDNQIEDKLQSLETDANSQLKNLDGQIEKGEVLEHELKRLRDDLGVCRTDLDKFESQKQVADEKVKGCLARINSAKAVEESRSNDVAKAEQEADSLLSSVSWEDDWRKSPKVFVTQLQSSATSFCNNRNRLQSLSAQIEMAKVSLENLDNVFAGILSAMPDWENLQSNACLVDRLAEKTNVLGNAVSAAVKLLNTADISSKDNESKLQEFLHNHQNVSMDCLVNLKSYSNDVISREENFVRRKNEDVVATQTVLSKAKEAYSNHESVKPGLTENDTLESLKSILVELDAQCKKTGEQIGSIKNELETDEKCRKRLSSLMEEMENAKDVYLRWERLNDLLGDAKGIKFRKVAQSYVLSNLIHSANSYMNTLTDRYRLKVEPGTFVISVEDAYQGYVSRPASTISGGESFLVSLSLALALSDIGQSLSVNTLFIDEGFGTLSGEPLQNAINTLRLLHGKAGRNVGIISHVDELKERISVQIQVNQEAKNSSSTVNVVS